MDMKAKMTELVTKAMTDKEFSKQLSENPTKAVESLTGLDLPDEQINKLLTKAKENPDFIKNLKDNPAKALEGITGLDLPDEQVNNAVKGLKDKILGGNK